MADKLLQVVPNGASPKATKSMATKIVVIIVFVLVVTKPQGSTAEESAASTSRIADAEIAERVRDLGRGHDRRMSALKWIESAGSPTIPHLLEALRGDNETAEYSCYALGIVGTNDQRVMDAFITTLRGNSPRSVRREVLGALRKWGPRAAPARFELAKIIEVGTPNEKQYAIEALGRIGEPALPVLSQLMQKEDRNVRLFCTRAYQMIGFSAFDSLRQLLDHEDWGIRHDVLYSMAACWNTAKEPRLLSKLIEDPDAMVRVDGVRLLGVWLNRPPGHSGEGDTGILKPLRGDTNPYMRYVAARTEEYLLRAQRNWYHVPPPLSPAEIKRRQNADSQLDRLGKEALRYLLQELETASGIRQLILVEWVGYMGKHAAEATDKLKQLPREAGSDLDNQIQAALTVIKQSEKADSLAQPDGAANGSQPFRSGTNQTSSAAGSRR